MIELGGRNGRARRSVMVVAVVVAVVGLALAWHLAGHRGGLVVVVAGRCARPRRTRPRRRGVAVGCRCAARASPLGVLACVGSGVGAQAAAAVERALLRPALLLHRRHPAG